jgi:hypothetical protein
MNNYLKNMHAYDYSCFILQIYNMSENVYPEKMIIIRREGGR